MDYKFVYVHAWNELKILSKWAWKGASQTVSWYEFDSAATLAAKDAVYDDISEPRFKTAKLIDAFFEDNPSEETRTAWGINENVNAILWLSKFLLDDNSYIVTNRDEFSVNGTRYQVVSLDLPLDMAEKEAVAVVGLSPIR